MEQKQQNNSQQQADPINKKGEVQQSNDQHIDQDFPGFPHEPAKEDTIDPKDMEDRIAANLNDEKEVKKKNEAATSGGAGIDEIKSDGSGGAFDATEAVPANETKKENTGEAY